MVPFISPKLAPWINFGNDTVILKTGAPEEVKPLYEKLKSQMEKVDQGSMKWKTE
ncbi:hypothetical protein [Paenibacillus periandrae]|uniref:hypothetical protein n=1 Tax=Paenibacillus periandrae TaxID=1761741 RepID=UPI001F092535|nr:hypothetical protein [Paenibacillus periandrae]